MLFRTWSLVLSLVLGCLLHHELGVDGLPILRVRGTHEQIGYQTGIAFRTLIRRYYDGHANLHSHWLPWSETPQGRKVVSGFLSAAQAHFPQYVSELRGLSLGAGLSFFEVFLMHHSVEISAILINSSRPSADSCSDIFLYQPIKGGVFLGHNEDNEPDIKNKTYIINASVINETRHVMEQFTAYCYPGHLPGNAFGFNFHGLVMTMNGLYPQHVLTGRVGRSFINRALLSARTVDEAIQLTRTPSAYGFSVNLGVTRCAHTKSELYNIESAPDPLYPAAVVDVVCVSASGSNMPASSKTSGGHYFHVNMYRRLKVDQISQRIISSQHRTTVIKHYPSPETDIDVLRILSDVSDSTFPIYRTPRPSDNETTLATALFDFSARVLQVFTDRPISSSGPLLTFSLPCLT